MDFWLGYVVATSMSDSSTSGPPPQGLPHDQLVLLGWVMLAAIPVAALLLNWMDKLLEEHNGL